MQTLKEFTEFWEPTEAKCVKIHESFCDLVNADEQLKALRDFVEANSWGMGERSFYWMWYLILRELEPQPAMMEIGVHRGQTLALWAMLRPDSHIYGLSPFDGAEVGPERDYEEDVLHIFDKFSIRADSMQFLKGYSDDPETIQTARDGILPFLIDVLYIDGGHSYETTCSDILNYTDLIRPGGFLVIDDCACKIPHKWGYFAGIQSVCRAVDELLPPFGWSEIGDQFEHLGAVVHNRIWKKK